MKQETIVPVLDNETAVDTASTDGSLRSMGSHNCESANYLPEEEETKGSLQKFMEDQALICLNWQEM